MKLHCEEMNTRESADTFKNHHMQISRVLFLFLASELALNYELFPSKVKMWLRSKCVLQMKKIKLLDKKNDVCNFGTREKNRLILSVSLSNARQDVTDNS